MLQALGLIPGASRTLDVGGVLRKKLPQSSCGPFPVAFPDILGGMPDNSFLVSIGCDLAPFWRRKVSRLSDSVIPAIPRVFGLVF